MGQSTLSEALPHSDEAERSVLGAILVDNHQFERAREIVTRGLLLRAAQPTAVRSAATAGRHRDRSGHRHRQGRTGARRGCWRSIGGAAYLAELLEGVPRSANVEHYARIVKEKEMLRDLIRCTQGILASALEAREGSTERTAGRGRKGDLPGGRATAARRLPPHQRHRRAEPAGHRGADAAPGADHRRPQRIPRARRDDRRAATRRPGDHRRQSRRWARRRWR